MGRRLTSTILFALSLCPPAWAQTADAPATPKLRDALRSCALMPSLDAEQAALDADATEEQMHALLQRSTRAFAGQVLAVVPLPYAMEIRFRVETPIRSTHAGEIVVLHEWVGLWHPGEQRYHAGERVLMFLQGVSAAGFASPVGGQQGIVPLHGDTQSGTLDLRWIAAHSHRAGAALTRILPQPYRSEKDSLSAYEPSADAIATVRAENASLPVVLSGSGHLPAPENPAITHASGALVLGMLSAWQQASQGSVREFVR